MDNYMFLLLEQKQQIPSQKKKKKKEPNSVKVLIKPTSCEDSNDGCTRNVVYQEVLKLAKLH